MFVKCDETPPEDDEPIMDRLHERYYESVDLQIQNISECHAGLLLTQKVFGFLSDENVTILVERMLQNKNQHAALRHLHRAFDPAYWNNRLRAIKDTCPAWGIMNIPDQVGLVQFGQLCLRRNRILQRQRYNTRNTCHV